MFKSALKRHTKPCTHISCCVGLQEVNNLSGDLYGKVKKCPSNGFNIAGSRLHPSLRGCADAALISLSSPTFSLSLLLFYVLHDGHCLTLIQTVRRTSFVLITVSRGLFFSFHTLPSVTRSIACVSVGYFLRLFFSFFKPTEDLIFRGLHVINLLLEVQEVRKVCCLASRLAISGHALNYSDNTHKYRKTQRDYHFYLLISDYYRYL